MFRFSLVLSYIDSFPDEATVTEEEYAVPRPCEEYCEERKVREKRLTEPGRSRIIEAMMHTPMLHLNPAEPDILNFLRDQYDLPKGMQFIVSTIFIRNHTAVMLGRRC